MSRLVKVIAAYLVFLLQHGRVFPLVYNGIAKRVPFTQVIVSNGLFCFSGCRKHNNDSKKGGCVTHKTLFFGNRSKLDKLSTSAGELRFTLAFEVYNRLIFRHQYSGRQMGMRFQATKNLVRSSKKHYHNGKKYD
jgi:hypothetical protein